MQTLFKLTSSGNTQTWAMEVSGSLRRTITGTLGYNLIISAWTQCIGKNIGKSNETTPEQQALKECENAYTKKLGGLYYDNVDDIGTPKYSEPMLAEKYQDAIDKDELAFPNYAQPKLDGIRCTITKAGMFTRKGKPIRSCPHIFEALKVVFDAHPSIELDGELYNHDYKDEFEALVSLIRKDYPTDKTAEIVEFHCYDLIAMDVVFSERIKAREAIFHGYIDLKSPIKLVKTYYCSDQEDLDIYYDMFGADGYEGQIIRQDTKYERKRTWNLLKRKDFVDNEYEIVEIHEGKGNWAGCAKRITFKLGDKTFGATLKGSKANAKRVYEEREDYIGGEATVTHFRFTSKGTPKFGTVKEVFKNERID